MDSKRIFYLDALRVTAIFAMMFLHVSSTNLYTAPVTNFDWQIFNVYNSLVRFCVPVLIMISGIFFLDPTRKITWKRLFTHNILRIATAFIFWSMAYACFSLFIQILWAHQPLDPHTIKAFLSNFINGQTHMWFLFTITGLYLITPLLRAFSENQKLLQYVIILSFLFCYLSNLMKLIPVVGDIVDSLISKMNLSFVSGYAGYFCLGYYLHKYEIRRTTQRKAYLLALISLIATITITSIWSVKTNTPVTSLYNYLLPNTFFVSCAIFIFFKYQITSIKFKENTVQKICRLSLLTFGMYLSHGFFITIFSSIGLTSTLFNPIFSVPLITIAVFICSLIVTFIISKIPFFNKYVI